MDELTKHKKMEMKKIAISLVICASLTFAIFAFSFLHSILQPNHYLEDFDFLVYHLQESFPFFGVAERRLGFDLDEWLPQAREQIANNRSEITFLARIEELNRRMANLANFRVMSAHIHSSTLFPYRYAGDELYLSATIAPLMSASQTMLTSIVEENRIARITFISFDHMRLPYIERNHLMDFMKDVRDFEHLIIDIRFVGGGWFYDQTELLIRPNITEPIAFYTFGFYKNGLLASQATLHQRQNLFARENIEHLAAAADPVGNTIYSARELVELYNLIYMNEDDLESLAYGYKLRTHIVPETNSPISFNGHIWVLTSDFNFLGAEAFARLSAEAGFTLVGQSTGSAIGGAATTHFRLPNSGKLIRIDTLYITDSLGRSKEEFPRQPHYFNRPGMTALSTALALIEEGFSPH